VITKARNALLLFILLVCLTSFVAGALGPWLPVVLVGVLLLVALAAIVRKLF
jgi:hypothetical protein